MKKSAPTTTVKSGPVTIPIYWLPSRETFLAKWTEDGQERRMRNKNLEELRKEVRKEAKRISGGRVDLSNLTQEEATICQEVLRRGLTLADLDTISKLEPISVSVAIERFLESKADTSGPNRRTLTTHLNQFAKTFGRRPISSITTEEMDQWLRDVAPGLRTRRNKRSCLVGLWRWARDKGMLPQDQRTVAERTDFPSLRQQKRERTIETWGPDELETILETVPAPYVPWVVLSAFAGLRTNELFPDDREPDRRKDVLQWEDIILTGKEPRIIVPAAVAKTAEKRVIPICPTLRAWLKTHRDRTGAVCPVRAPWNHAWKTGKNPDPKSVIEVLTAALGGTWRKNALRHSFGTYRVLQVGAVGPVALEMGNSERMVKSHYHDAGRTKKEAEAWFSLTPGMVDRSLQVVA